MLTRPTFGGYDPFGTVIKMKAAQINPPAQQQTSVAGLNGVEEINLGLRGAWTTVTGKLNASSSAALGSAIASFRSFYGTGVYTLTDQFGYSWPNVRLESFAITSDIKYSFIDSYWYADYEAKFFHLTLP